MMILAIILMLMLLVMGLESYFLSPERHRKKEIAKMADASRNRQEKKRTWPQPQGGTMENRCICCGEIIPEGRQVCPSCMIKKG